MYSRWLRVLSKAQNIAFAWNHRHPWRLYSMSTFANRRSRCKELGKKVPQAYRVYVEDTFLPCDAADTRIFAKENFLSLYNALHDTHLQLSCPVENIRLDNTLYMNIINDVSCLVDNKIIVLTEHPRSRMYIRVHSWAASLQGKLVPAWNQRHPCRFWYGKKLYQ